MGYGHSMAEACYSMPDSYGYARKMSGAMVEDAEEDGCEDEDEDNFKEMSIMKSMKAPMMKAEMASAPINSNSSLKGDYYQSEAIRCTVNQIKSKKAARKKL